MKILLLNQNLKGIGTYRRSFYFARELARAGHTTTLMTVSRDSSVRPRMYFKRDWPGVAIDPNRESPCIRIIEGPGLGYAWLPGRGSGPLDIALRVKEILRGDYDAVLGFEYQPNVSWPVYLTRGLRKYRFVSDWCDWHAGSSNWFRGIALAHRIDGFFEERIRFLARKVSVTSRALLDRALDLGISPERVVHIPEGATPDYIGPLPQSVARRKLGLPTDVPIVVAVRNGDMLREVRIARIVLRTLPQTLFLFVGRESAQASNMVRSLGLTRGIVSTGWVADEEYPEYLACADLCFCPLNESLNDRARWPAKILDFLCAGRATVTNDVGEAGNLFRTSEVGVLAEHGDEAFAQTILTLLEDAERRYHYAQNARRVMVEAWDYTMRRRLIAGLVED